MKGIVTKSTGSWYTVMDGDGRETDCRLKGKFKLAGSKSTNPLAVGDHVEFLMQPEEDTGLITAISPRKNYIIRKATKLSKVSHVLAANLDQAMIIATLAEPRTSTGFIDRFLITAEAYHIPAAVFFNKTDLYNEGQMEELRDLEDIYRRAGYITHSVSARSGQGLGRFREVLNDRVTLIAGHSGVGKSTLINCIEPSLDLKVKPISKAHKKGLHTTTFARMFRLSFGAFIIDTPGIKEFGLYELDRATLAERYPEMRALMHQCRYANCTHLHEPGCAVKKAVAEGAISESRYDGYLRIMAGEIL